MPNAHEFGDENSRHGICGFTSTIYAVYENMPHMRHKIDTSSPDAATRLMAEIKTFLVLMKAQGKQSILNDIRELTQSFGGVYATWTPDSYISKINATACAVGVDAVITNYSIAIPPNALMEYMKEMWGFNPAIALSGHNAIVGLTRTGAPHNRFGNLAHYVYEGPDGTLYSWGQEFSDLNDLNTKKHRDYSVVSRIKVNA